MTVEKVSWTLPITDEYVVDYGIGTEEQQRAAGERIEARQAEMRAYWLSLPRYVRLARRIRPRIYEARYRLAHASRALRGIDCDRD